MSGAGGDPNAGGGEGFGGEDDLRGMGAGGLQASPHSGPSNAQAMSLIHVVEKNVGSSGSWLTVVHGSPTRPLCGLLGYKGLPRKVAAAR